MQTLCALCTRSFCCFFSQTSCHRKIQGIQQDSREHSQNEVDKWLVLFLSVQSISPRPILLAYQYQEYFLQIQLIFSHLACQHMIHMPCFSYSVNDASTNLHGSSRRSTISFASPRRSCLRKSVRTGWHSGLVAAAAGYLPQGNSESFQICKKLKKQTKQYQTRYASLIQGHIQTNKPSCPCPCHSFHESLLQRHGNGFSHFLSKWKSQTADIDLYNINLHFTEDENHFPLTDDLY